ncbi:MAG: C39 family peptidase [Caldilineaceae bacterium]
MSRSPLTIAILLVITAGALIVLGGVFRLQAAPNQVSRTKMIFATRQARINAHRIALPGADQTPTPVPVVQEETRPAFTPILIPTATPLPSPTPLPIYQSAQAAVELNGFNHQWQTWNNCGPATLSMNLSYYGSSLTQADIGAVLRRDPDDKNVSPEELVDFARTQGFQAQLRVNGNSDLMRLFLSNGIPVIIETWLEPEPNDGMGHYRMLTGYSDADQRWTGYDSYVSQGLIGGGKPYRGIVMPYGETEELWNVFDHTYVLIYPEEKASIVQAILGATFSEQAMWQTALQQTQAMVNQEPDDPFAWFNLGTNLVAVKDYANAAAAYDRAEQIGLPWRMLWYQFGIFQAYYETGQYQKVIKLVNDTLVHTQTVEELYYWKGRALAALGDPNNARVALQRSLKLNPDYAPANQALTALNGQ